MSQNASWNPFSNTISPENFVFWLNGFLTSKKSLNEEEFKFLRSFLDMVQIPIKDDGKPSLALQEPFGNPMWSPADVTQPLTGPRYPGLSSEVEVTC